MKASFQEFELRIVAPSYDSPLVDTLMELNHLRKLKIGGTTYPNIFFQLKKIFHMLESVGSARIEGNRTTIAEYVEQKIEKSEHSTERFSEIANVEEAMNFIEESVEKGTEFTHQFIRELHQLAVRGLNDEGDKTPGAYRTWNVKILQSEHQPPEAHMVSEYMDQLLSFVNGQEAEKYDLLKTALAHHRFTWIHPFGNGNGRVVRLLTYAMMIKYGFNVKEGQLINPTAVFCNDRERYYNKLSEADRGTDESLLSWCEYVLSGVLLEVTKVNKLMDFDYLHKNILVPTLDFAVEREYLNSTEAKILRVGLAKQEFKASDLEPVLGAMTSRQRTHQINKMKESGFIVPVEENARTYYVNFMNNTLMRGLIKVLEQQNFIPKIDI